MSQVVQSSAQLASVLGVRDDCDPRVLPAEYPPLPKEASEPGRNYYFLGWPVDDEFFDSFVRYHKLTIIDEDTRITSLLHIIRGVGTGYNLRVVRAKVFPGVPPEFIVLRNGKPVMDMVALCSTGNPLSVDFGPTAQQYQWLVDAFGIPAQWLEDAFPKEEYSIHCDL
ncbi:hypothetical protein HGRIS_005411 [Hohenbuehelia grisea]|uniref:Uncharacterized protein n=1 Tax=Hohenbuehelia grisea TaxID=104357 RepID=A0ABR3JFU7_9AGAR